MNHEANRLTILRNMIDEALRLKGCEEQETARTGAKRGRIDAISRLLESVNRELEAEVKAQTQTLLEEKRFLDNVVSTASIFIVVLDHNGDITYMNPFALELSGYDEAEVLGRNWFENFIGGELREGLKAAFSQILEGKRTYGGHENAILCRDGTSRIIQWQNAIIEGNDAKSRHIISMGIDVTDRKRAEERQAYLSRILHSINEASNAIIRSHTEEELFERVCDILAKESGYGLAWIGLTDGYDIRLVCHSEDPTGYLENGFYVSVEPGSKMASGPVGQSVQNRKTVVIRDTASDPAFEPWRDRAERAGFRSVMFTPLTSGSDMEPIGTMGVYSYRDGGFEAEEAKMLEELASRIATAVYSYEQARQIRELNRTLGERVEQQTSELREVNEVLRRRLHEIEEKNSQLVEAKEAALAAASAKSSFISGISHELRTPLNAIINFSDQILEDYDEMRDNPELREEGRQFLERVLRNSRHLLELINEILDFAKIDAGKMEYDIRPIEINELLSHAHNNFYSLMRGNRDVTYAMKLHGEPLWAELDPKRFSQIIINLLSNAIKFTRCGAITLRSMLQEGYAVIEITDTGKGIPAEKLETIFAPFEQVSSSDQGTGLGLVLVHKMCEAMGIGIDLSSREGKGTTFRLSVPLQCTARNGEK